MKSVTEMIVEQSKWRIRPHQRNPNKIEIYDDSRGMIAELWKQDRGQEIAEIICKVPEMLRLLEMQQESFAKMQMRYLGCAALLGEAMAHVSNGETASDLRESAEEAMLDAAVFAGGKVVKLGKRLEIQFTHPAQATTTTTT